MQTAEGDGSRTYASLDKSTKEAKDIEYANPIPAQGYINASLSENMSKTMVDCLIDVERKSRILKLK